MRDNSGNAATASDKYNIIKSFDASLHASVGTIDKSPVGMPWTMLGNGDQLIGPSHFMRSDLDEAHMKRIWEYNVEPLIDDLFYGDSDAIRSFKWAQVLNRFQKSPAGGAEAAATV